MSAVHHVRDLDLSHDIADFIRGSHGGDIGSLVDILSGAGDSAIFGGLPRDFAREGRNAFNSDVDVVVDASPDMLDTLLAALGGHRNRFGGYRLKYGRFDFDVWALQSTWAVSNGYVAAHSLNDLIKTTFFDCDAVLFHCRTLEITSSDRFWTSIKHGIVDINLEANPHYIGTLARTLRILLDWRQDLGPKLTSYLVEGMARNGGEIVDYVARNGLGRCLAAGSDPNAVILEICKHVAGRSSCNCLVKFNPLHYGPYVAGDQGTCPETIRGLVAVASESQSSCRSPAGRTIAAPSKNSGWMENAFD
ncbi:hypothetical protein ATCR1_19631 [Agrobacterium tumefaciens CCNWGS0286]|uniref:hypothetical protein n=1 Tax=Agrobacterium tumefaciens TaxID=358 RepID=UPI000233331B|nr:hypothetical protein [Agrobacterium tumefaciens]EHH03922.1 hypothetical protein ATCR1_19631 [Agrobacterium tumefaciens CCNWGS0286]